MHQNQVRVTAVSSEPFGLKPSCFGKSDLTGLPVNISGTKAAAHCKVFYVAKERYRYGDIYLFTVLVIYLPL